MTTSQKANKEKFQFIYTYLETLIDNPKCELEYSKDYELLIAVLLSAQCHDLAVNKVTKILFERYKTIQELSLANLSDIEQIIRPLGMYKVKAKNVLLLSKELVNKYNGVVINDPLILESLPGVGHKTMGVVRGELFHEFEFPVDTHVKRLAYRLGFVKEDCSPSEVEAMLKSLMPKNMWMKSHHLLIHFGRYFCKAKNPKCSGCRLKDFCVHFKKNT